MMAGEFPRSFRDPLYASLDASNEEKFGLPAGLLSSIRVNGERSNADQVSSAKASTPYQIIPATRQAAIDKYGVDPTLSPQNASEVAARLLKDSLDRNKGDAAAAVGEYVGGTNRDNWGKVTNAYINRVMVGLQPLRTEALDTGFAAWMKANPAVPEGQSTAAVPPAGAPAAPAAADPLSEGFGAFLASQQNRDVQAIPGQDGRPVPAPTQPADPGLVQKMASGLIGSQEAALTLATGATTGMAGGLMGAANQIGGDVANLAMGRPTSGRGVGQAFTEGADALTYSPRTDAGKQALETITPAIQSLVPLAGLGSEASAAGRAVATAAPAARVAAESVSATAKAVPREAAAAISSVTGKLRPALAERTPTPGTQGSVGAAGTDLATIRRERAQQLPVPVELTEGQATRQFEQQRFERETAKEPGAGAPLRDRFAMQNERLLKNFDAFVDLSGAEAPSLRAAGVAVDQALVKQFQADKAKVRVAYKNAEKAGELEAPVTLSTLVEHLNEAAPDAATAPILDVARKRALRLGLAIEDGAGELVPQPVTLKTAETMRQAIGGATDYEPTNVRQATIMKGLIDESTDSLGGTLYKQARAERRRLAQNYEDRAVINKLLTNKRGTSDRNVALEDVFAHSVLDGSLDDVRNVRRVLQRAGPDGHQAWSELQGQTISYLKTEATKNVARDIRGNEIISAAALDRAIKKLDADGKLDFVFGKRGAEKLRDINDIAKDVYTTPPGAVNTSNTASVLLAALDMGMTSVSGIPLPVLSGLRLLTRQVKDRALAKRVESSLTAPPPRKQPASTF